MKDCQRNIFLNRSLLSNEVVERPGPYKYHPKRRKKVNQILNSVHYVTENPYLEMLHDKNRSSCWTASQKMNVTVIKANKFFQSVHHQTFVNGIFLRDDAQTHFIDLTFFFCHSRCTQMFHQMRITFQSATQRISTHWHAWI